VVTQVLGVDINKIFLTMLSLVGLYLVLTHAGPLNTLVKTIASSSTDSLIILQGRNPRTVR
jgi:hypothetical protein